jgi:hypothetical protein
MNLGSRGDLEGAVEGLEAEFALLLLLPPIWEVTTGVQELEK